MNLVDLTASSMNATFVSREERVAAPHGSATRTRSDVEQVEHSVRQRCIVGNLGRRSRNPISAIPACNVVLDRDRREDERARKFDIHAITSVPVKNVVTYH